MLNTVTAGSPSSPNNDGCSLLTERKAWWLMLGLVYGAVMVLSFVTETASLNPPSAHQSP